MGMACMRAAASMWGCWHHAASGVVDSSEYYIYSQPALEGPACFLPLPRSDRRIGIEESWPLIGWICWTN